MAARPPGAKLGTSSGSALGRRLRQVFPRHHLQDEITHFLTIVALVIGVVGFLLALFPPLGAGLYALAWLLFAIVLLLFVMHRDATLAGTRSDQAEDALTGRHHAGRGASPDRAEQGGAVLREPQTKK